MKFVVRLFVFGLLASMYLAAPASAQYLKITTDNATDNTRLNATGPTQLTITLDTNHDKDGSLQTCNSHSVANCGATAGGQPLTLFSYQVYLRAVGGTVSWGTFVAGDAAYTPLTPQLSDPTDVEFTFARPPGTVSAPGLNPIGTIPVTIVSGSPSISVVRFPENTTGTLDPTSFGTTFGTQCDAFVIGNTYILGNVADPCGLVSGAPADWYDADGAGAPIGTNVPPFLTQPSNMTVDEGTTANQTLTATDADNDPITFSLLSGPTFATVTTTTPGTGTGTGNLHLAPGFADQGSNISVTVRASDGANSNDKTLSVTVNNVNRAPTLNAISNMTVNEGVTADQVLTGTDPDGDPLVFTRATGPAFFTVVSGSVHLAPGFDDSGTYSASATASDGNIGGTNTKSFTITVNNVDRPVTLNGVADMTVAPGATSDQLITATDADEEAITFTFTGPAYMTVTPNAQVTTTRTANIHLAPPGGTAAGTVNASVTATAAGVLATENFVITVTGGANAAPVLAQPANMTVNENATADQTLNATDADGDPLTFSLVSGPAYATVTTTTPGTGTGVGNLHLAPGFTDAGTATVTVRASDGTTNNDKTLTVTVNNVNRDPTLTQPANMTVNEGATADQTITAVDADDEPLTFTLVTGPTFASVTTTAPGTGTGTGNIHLAPGFSDAGTYAATVRASDGTGNNDKTITITVNNVNRDPVLTQPSDMTVTEGATADQTLNATDPDGQALTFSLATGPTFASVTTTTPGTGTAVGNLHLAPVTGDAGTYNASVSVSDGSATDSGSLLITVNPFVAGNNAPTLAQPSNMTVDEGATADQTLNATDPDGNPLSFSLVTGPLFATVTTTTPGTGTAVGNIHLAPGFSDAGTYAATVRASDGSLNDDKSLTITVNNVNQAPVLTQPSNMTVTEGSTNDQTLNATDADGQALTFSLATGPTFASVTTTTPGTGTATGNVHLAPTTGDAGTYAATVSVSDGSLDDSATFTITVNPFVAGNEAPILIQPTDMTVNEGATADQTLNATDPDGDALTFTLLTGPGFATVTTTSPGTGTAAGNLHLAPGFSDDGTYSVTVRVSDGSLNNDKTLTITVNDVGGGNQPPVLAQPTDMTVDEGLTADQTLSATDPDGDTLTFSKAAGPAFMTVSGAGVVHLAPGFADAGTYTGTAQVSDGSLTDSKSFTITVNNVNRAPTADAGGPYAGVVNVAVSFSGTGSSDPDGDPLTYSWDFDATDGIQEDATGPTPSHTYTSAGSYTVTLTVSDNGTPQLTDTDTATANISPTGFTVNIFLNGGSKNIRLNTGKPFWCIGLSPASSAFEVTDIIASSIRASFGGVSIPALRTKGIVDDEGDDGDGRLRVCFSKDNLLLLFASLGNGNQNVEVLITGDLVNGASFSGTVDVNVQKGGAGGLAKGKDDKFGHANPNPFNPSTTISFELSEPGSVRLRIYNVSGRLVNTLTDGFMGSGPHEVRWNGTSTDGSRVSSGVYFFILETPERVVKSQLVVAK